eukprot:COSAG02_NODE_56901_length_283_cov_0.809783_2_plen_34_part_01
MSNGELESEYLSAKRRAAGDGQRKSAGYLLTHHC